MEGKIAAEFKIRRSGGEGAALGSNQVAAAPPWRVLGSLPTARGRELSSKSVPLATLKLFPVLKFYNPLLHQLTKN